MPWLLAARSAVICAAVSALSAVSALPALSAPAAPAAGALAAQGESSPAQPVRMCAEWEPAAGTLIRWPLGIPGTLAAELSRDDSLYVLVETAGQESQARSTLSAYGADLSHVRFIRAQTYSHWTRDWGPHSVFDGQGVWGITDPIFDGYPWVDGCFLDGQAPAETAAAMDGAADGYEEDDAVNAALAAELGCPLHELPAFCTGGNLMVDGHGQAFSTRRMVNENAPLWSEAQFRQLAREYLGIHTYHLLDDPEFHGIQHIDCTAKLLDEETVLIKQVAPSHPEYACIERLADQIAAATTCFGRPYRIVRIACGAYAGTSVAAYTNSLILNRKVFVPTFGISSDGPALETYRAAMPGYEVIGVASSSWYWYDALHCRTMGIFDRHMLRIEHRRLDEEMPLAPHYPIDARIDDRSESGLVETSLRLHWRLAGDPAWRTVALEALAAADSFRAILPGQAPGAAVHYYLAAADQSGRSETLPRTAPDGYYAFTVSGQPAGARETAWSGSGLSLACNPCIRQAALHLDLERAGSLRLTVHDGAGRLVRVLAHGTERLEAGRHRLSWDGRDDAGRLCESGSYWIRAGSRIQGLGAARRCLLLR